MSSTEGNRSLHFTYQIEDGVESNPDYGIELAAMAGIPKVVIESAREIKSRIQQFNSSNRCTSAENRYENYFLVPLC